MRVPFEGSTDLLHTELLNASICHETTLAHCAKLVRSDLKCRANGSGFGHRNRHVDSTMALGLRVDLSAYGLRLEIDPT